MQEKKAAVVLQGTKESRAARTFEFVFVGSDPRAFRRGFTVGRGNTVSTEATRSIAISTE